MASIGDITSLIQSPSGPVSVSVIGIKSRLEARVGSEGVGSSGNSHIRAEQDGRTTEPNLQKLNKKPHIAVIGAGVSGLRAAGALLETEGYEVTVLEARGRIGGRVNMPSYLG